MLILDVAIDEGHRVHFIQDSTLKFEGNQFKVHRLDLGDCRFMDVCIFLHFQFYKHQEISFNVSLGTIAVHIFFIFVDLFNCNWTRASFLEGPHTVTIAFSDCPLLFLLDHRRTYI